MLMLFIGTTQAQSSSTIEDLIARLPSTPYIIENIKDSSDYSREATEKLIKEHYSISPKLITIKPEEIVRIKNITDSIGKEVTQMTRSINSELSIYDNLIGKINSNEKVDPIISEIKNLLQLIETTRIQELNSIKESYYQTFFCLVKAKNYSDSMPYPEYQAECYKAIDNDVVEKGIGVFVESKSKIENKELIYDSVKTVIKGTMNIQSSKRQIDQENQIFRVAFELKVKISDIVESGTNVSELELDKLRENKNWYIFTSKPSAFDGMSGNNVNQPIVDQNGDTLDSDDIQFIETCIFNYEDVKFENQENNSKLKKQLSDLAIKIKGIEDQISNRRKVLAVNIRNIKDAISEIRYLNISSFDSLVPQKIIDEAKLHLKQKKESKTKIKTIIEYNNIMLTQSSPVKIYPAESVHHDIASALFPILRDGSRTNAQKKMQELTLTKNGITDQYENKFNENKTFILDKIWFYVVKKSDHMEAYVLLKNRTAVTYSENELETDLDKKERLKKIERENQLKLQQIAKRQAYIQDSILLAKKNREDSIAKITAWNNSWHVVSKDSIFIRHDFYKDYNSYTDRYVSSKISSKIHCSSLKYLVCHIIHPSRGEYTFELVKSVDSYSASVPWLNLRVSVRANYNLLLDDYILDVKLSDLH